MMAMMPTMTHSPYTTTQIERAGDGFCYLRQSHPVLLVFLLSACSASIALFPRFVMVQQQPLEHALELTPTTVATLHGGHKIARRWCADQKRTKRTRSSAQSRCACAARPSLPPLCPSKGSQSGFKASRDSRLLPRKDRFNRRVCAHSHRGSTCSMQVSQIYVTLISGGQPQSAQENGVTQPTLKCFERQTFTAFASSVDSPPIQPRASTLYSLYRP